MKDYSEELRKEIEHQLIKQEGSTTEERLSMAYDYLIRTLASIAVGAVDEQVEFYEDEQWKIRGQIKDLEDKLNRLMKQQRRIT